jgi:predicted Fe-Mo cluster-binding NifX family protein
MRVCVPLLATSIPGEPVGDFQLAAHFGLAERFVVIDSESCSIVGECPSAGHCKGPCACPLPSLGNHGIEALAGQALGFRLLQMSRRAGLPVLDTRARTVGELCRELSQKKLRAMPAAVCFKNARSRVAGRG